MGRYKLEGRYKPKLEGRYDLELEGRYMPQLEGRYKPELEGRCGRSKANTVSCELCNMQPIQVEQ